MELVNFKNGYFYGFFVRFYQNSCELLINEFFLILISYYLKEQMDVEIPKKLQELNIISQSSIIKDNLVVNLQIKSPENSQAVRAPISVICVLDISGSMDTEATPGGAVQSDGFTRLDLVKHSVNTIINSLENGDVLGIVTFSDSARVDFNLVEMTEENKTKAL